ncbi:hypothetical protein GGX14DRAFT_400895 [Mycena pura]|uniref:Uncharacterized protein n=1 Tax=Mycena pura TaxID=153505 RepID=A0AAD6Y939_9AGAR|nr:hypothetical protein GGX14DRAFT_400895 [Mycena pura]
MSTLPPPPKKRRNVPDAPGLATRSTNKDVRPAEAAGLVQRQRAILISVKSFLKRQERLTTKIHDDGAVRALFGWYPVFLLMMSDLNLPNTYKVFGSGLAFERARRNCSQLNAERVNNKHVSASAEALASAPFICVSLGFHLRQPAEIPALICQYGKPKAPAMSGGMAGKQRFGGTGFKVSVQFPAGLKLPKATLRVAQSRPSRA